MTARAPTLRTLLRTTTTLRPATQPARPFSQLQNHSRSRSPSPPPPYAARNVTFLAAHSWTRFHTPYTYSSVRTFASTPRTSAFVPQPPSSSTAATKIDEVMEEITELYGTARDEFEIAAEETEKNTTYAADDRAAAREELDRLLEYYGGVLEGDPGVAEEVKRRVGQRVRELEQAVLGMEESVTHGD
ncbi:uncharacterized protein CC84DRAFT_1161576 [Paraphaeosphaeria sporulosa]|uniref:Uncharacterized protein n=1 Tax=Paraphaeosphaeria sporulosa TaxID=1460663 RepID=A0A177CV87_9PLEO|nr:uncharacterized protein CC84DRAFT_1161576 [Paraphaeosphaeria sporulosa]OAG10707.1 hypothetical protein CC84DRAFT_1161576 [Paraphaeosphaeria sporulosa]